MKTAALLLILSFLPLISAQGQMQEPSIIVLSYNFTDNNTPTSITDPTTTSSTIKPTTTLKQPPIQPQKTTTTIKPTSSTYKSSSRVSPLPPKNTSWIPEIPKIELPDLKTAIPVIGIIILVISYLWHLGGKDENSND